MWEIGWLLLTIYCLGDWIIKMSNAKDTTNFTIIYLQTDMTLMWYTATSAIKTSN